MVAQFLIGALAKAHGPDDIPPLLADDPSDPFAINSDPFSVLNLACPSDPCYNAANGDLRANHCSYKKCRGCEFCFDPPPSPPAPPPPSPPAPPPPLPSPMGTGP